MILIHVIVIINSNAIIIHRQFSAVTLCQCREPPHGLSENFSRASGLKHNTTYIVYNLQAMHCDFITYTL